MTQFPEIDSSLDKCSSAQRILSDFSQKQVDRLVDGLHQASLPNLEKWARMAVEETGYGNIQDKTTKNRFCAVNIYEYIKPMKTVGFVKADVHNGIFEVASPVGIIAAVIPSTNPTSTAIFKIMVSIKARNGIILSPHPRACRCINEVANTFIDALNHAGAPEGIVACLKAPSIEATQYLMSHKKTNLILATGGIGLVRAAYSSGKPAYGVGPGNVPAFIERSANLPKAISDILAGKCFDYGTVCASEQSIIVDSPLFERAVEELKSQGAYILSDSEISSLEGIMVLENFTINPKIVGKSAVEIGKMARIPLPDRIRCLIAPLKGVGRNFPLSMEKLSPVLSLYQVRDWLEGCERCIEVLNFGGMGHTMTIHTKNREVLREFALKKPAFRIIVNSSGTHGAIGLSTGLPPSMTLGCGALGNNITSDNITPFHLMDRKRIAFEQRTIGEYPLQPVIPLIDEDDDLVKSFLREKGYSPFPREIHHPNTQREKGEFPTLRDLRSDEVVLEFICEEDVKKAKREGKKLFYNSKTKITPLARDIGKEWDILVSKK